ncbi:UDP-N-acetylmuramyl-tripeptide synthetase [Candidatus Azambacteria bacterium]|nr:UDP-N-acetylmuramyl-tripeptide synthetase [Candidatus Azambacteria bacterium]MBI3685404.1 UDP-N-acetylmuramyl-tripeptide synthetase [Candidatus Azambacteria bacterium]
MALKSSVKQLIPSFLISAYHFSLAFMAALWYGFPSGSMIVIGVTGTKGKSSTIFMCAKILEEAGMKVAVSSSLMFKIKENEWLNPYHMTMAGRFKLQEFLYQAKTAGCTHALIETTSEGIKQYRHRFINFDVAAFTNLSPEHIEAHGGFENYKQAKGKLFAALEQARRKTLSGKQAEKISVVNMDDEHAAYFSGFKADKKYGFSIKGACKGAGGGDTVCVFASAVKVDASGIAFTADDVSFSLHVLGEFNIYNAFAAAVIAKSLGVDFNAASAALKKIEEIPGRMKFVREGQKFTAIIDLAHTPSSFEGAFGMLATLKQPHGRIIAVFGSAGGGRDKWKRPELGKIAARYCDYIILTNEDSYDEDPDAICAAIAEGISAAGFHGVLETIQDRRKAIRTAVDKARWNDIVIFLGKGTEQTMVTKEGPLPWNEEGIVIEEIRNMLYDRK